MNFDEYQELAARTANQAPNSDAAAANYALGLCGEAGEAAEIVKKALFHGKTLDRTAFCKELGDVLWYLAMSAMQQGLTLSEVASANIEKLEKRYPHGFGKRCDQQDDGA